MYIPFIHILVLDVLMAYLNATFSILLVPVPPELAFNVDVIHQSMTIKEIYGIIHSIPEL